MHQKLLKNLADLLLSAAWEPEGLSTAIAATYPSLQPRHTKKILSHLATELGWSCRPSPPKLHAVLNSDELHETVSKLAKTYGAGEIIRSSGAFFPAAGYARSAIPPITTVPALAAFLETDTETISLLEQGNRTLLHRAAKNAPHYRFKKVQKANGGIRLIEMPLPKLKAVQRKINQKILRQFAPHAAAYAFRRGKSCITNAALHGGEEYVLSCDFENFFSSISAGRVSAVFRRIGFPIPLCQTLTDMTMARYAEGVDSFQFTDLSPQLRKQLLTYHLPQGAPTSPLLSNLVCYQLDVRLSECASKFGLRYSRYADDLTFSGDRIGAKREQKLLDFVAHIAEEFGLNINHRKTRRSYAHQRQVVTGVIVNQHTNISREQYDTLKAIIHNCSTVGPELANRDRIPNFEYWLAGKVAWTEAVNPVRGRKLRDKFENIDW